MTTFCIGLISFFFFFFSISSGDKIMTLCKSYSIVYFQVWNCQSSDKYKMQKGHRETTVALTKMYLSKTYLKADHF